MSDKDRIAALEAEVAVLKGKIDPPKSTFVPMSDAEWIDKMHQMREGRANSWMPPSAVREMVAAEPRGFMKGVVGDSRAPQSPSTLPSSQQRADVRPVAGDGSGWVAPTPLGPPPGVAQADRLMDVQDAKDRAALVERQARFEALAKIAEGKS